MAESGTSGQKNRKRGRGHISALLFALILANVDQDGLVPIIKVTRRAAVILETNPDVPSYSDETGRRSIRRALSDLSRLTSPPVIELIKHETSNQLKSIKISRNAAVAERRRRFKLLFDEKLVGKPGGRQFSDIAGEINVDERTVRRWAAGQQSVAKHFVYPLVKALNPGADNLGIALVYIACEVLAFVNELVELGLNDSEVWKASKTAHGARLERMGVKHADISQLRSKLTDLDRYATRFMTAQETFKSFSGGHPARQTAIREMTRIQNSIKDIERKNQIIRLCHEEALKLQKEHENARANI